MPDLATLSIFLTAAFILSITPGPGILYTLARSLHGGRAVGIASVMGLFVGGLFHVVAAALGLSSLLMTSAIAFSIVKYIGAAYLIYLGLKTLLSSDTLAIAADASYSPMLKSSAFTQGVMTEVLNPKTALFFLAFIPQFVQVENGSVLAQFLVLGLITTSFNFAADLAVATFAGPLGQRLKTNYQFRRLQRLVSGSTLMGLGAYVAVAEQN
ncbi:LysE family translocator [Sphaerothrix gracilis]|uniref:LysE family translocator n=1 Tax=Sphaerothrix gracilis TaxID=3151835 RepID=UPI0031FDD355